MVRSGSSDIFVDGWFNRNRFWCRAVSRVNLNNRRLRDMFGGDLFHRIGDLFDWMFRNADLNLIV